MPKKAKARGARSSHRNSDAYTWFVRVSRVALPLLALFIIGVVIARLSDDPQIAQLSELPTHEKTKPGQISLVKAKYEGMDAKGRKYTLSAESATRDITADEAVFLDRPRADIALDGGWITVHADKGRFDNKMSKLFLSNGVTVYHDSGYEIHMQDVSVDLTARQASSPSPLTAQGPVGELRAQNVAVTGQGDLIVFGGPARVTLHRAKPQPPHGRPG